MVLPLESNKIVALVAIRRSGKTYLLYQTMLQGLTHETYSRVSESRMASAFLRYLKVGGPPEGIRLVQAWRYLLEISEQAS